MKCLLFFREEFKLLLKETLRRINNLVALCWCEHGWGLGKRGGGRGSQCAGGDAEKKNSSAGFCFVVK